MFDVKIDEATAELDVRGYLNKKKLFPAQVEKLEGAIDVVKQAVMYGFVVFNEDGSITQTLIEPISSLDKIEYKPRIAASEINKRVAALKKDGPAERLLCYVQAYTGLLATQVNQLETQDRQVTDCIALFLQ